MCSFSFLSLMLMSPMFMHFSISSARFLPVSPNQFGPRYLDNVMTKSSETKLHTLYQVKPVRICRILTLPALISVTTKHEDPHPHKRHGRPLLVAGGVERPRTEAIFRRPVASRPDFSSAFHWSEVLGEGSYVVGVVLQDL